MHAIVNGIISEVEEVREIQRNIQVLVYRERVRDVTQTFSFGLLTSAPLSSNRRTSSGLSREQAACNTVVCEVNHTRNRLCQQK